MGPSFHTSAPNMVRQSTDSHDKLKLAGRTLQRAPVFQQLFRKGSVQGFKLGVQFSCAAVQ